MAGPSGIAQVAGSSVLGPILYIAFTQQLRTDGLLPRDREPCLVDDVNGKGMSPGFYLGRLAGSHTGLPVYEVGWSAGSDGDSLVYLKVISTIPAHTTAWGGEFYDVLMYERDDAGGLRSTGNGAWLYTPNQASLVAGQFFPGNRIAELVAGRPVFASQLNLFAFVKCNSDTVGLGGYDARFMRFLADGTLLEVGAELWLLAANTDTPPIKDRVYFCALSGFNFGRWVYQIEGSVLVRFARCDTATPSSGRYTATLMTENADGTLTASASEIWLRDGNNTPALINGEVYACKRTGYTANKPVYTTVDFNLTVRDEDLSQSQSRVLYEEFGPTTNWAISSPGTRRALIKRILNVREGTTGVTTFTWQIDFNSADFDVVATAAGHATISTEGVTETFYVLTRCTGGQLKARQLTFVRGLLDAIGAEVNDPG